MERTNARYLTPEQFAERPRIAVMDVSFISIRLILPAAAAVMGDGGVFYTLIKPQFEAGRENVGKNGVVRDPVVHEDVINGIIRFAEGMDWKAVSLDYSPITGPKGNIEFLLYMQKSSTKNDASLHKFSEIIPEIVKNAHSMGKNS
jgi:23S rRNA (cytidine1920-2'-O)/16S rRNA (cytidine1409-2'-O)-methyltransferase